MTIFEKIAQTLSNVGQSVGQKALEAAEKWQNLIGAEGNTIQERLSGVGQKALKTAEKWQNLIGAEGETIGERALGAAKTIGTSAYNLAKDITLTYPSRTAGSIFLDIANALNLTGKKEIVPETPVEKFFWGNEPVKAFSQKLEESIPVGGAIGQSLLGKPGAALGKTIAPFVVGGMAILDLVPFGGSEKKLGEELLKTKTAEEAAGILRKTKIPEEIISKYAPKFASAKKIDEVNSVLSKMTDELKSVSGVVEAGKVSDNVKPLVEEIPKELEQLVEEAKKYKSAEEFASTMANKTVPVTLPNGELNPNWSKEIGKEFDKYYDLYNKIINPQPVIKPNEVLIHFTGEDIKGSLKPVKGVLSMLASNNFKDALEIGKIYGGKNYRIFVASDISKLKIYDLDVESFNQLWRKIENNKKLINQLKKHGYDGIRISDIAHSIGGETIPHSTIMLFDTGIKKAKIKEINQSQLENLFNTTVKQVEKTISKTEEISKISEEIKKVHKLNLKERGFVESVKETYPELRVAGQYIPRSTDELAIKARNLIRDNIEEAERIARNYTDDKAVATGVELIKHYSDLAEKAIDKATKDALNDRAAEIANDLARRLTEQGRSVQAASILGRLTPEGQVRFAAKEIQKYNEMVEKSKGGIFGLKKKIPELTGEQADYILTEMKAISKMPEGEEKAIRFSKLQDYVSSLVPSPFYQKWISVWKAGLLTGLKTSGVNIFSNTSHFGLETLKDIPATIIDSVASLFTGKRTLSFTLKGIPEGIKEGFEKGWRYLKTGYSERNLGIKYDYKKVSFGNSKIAKSLQKYEETVFRIIGSEDQPFYYGAKARSLYDQAIAAGKTKRLKGKELEKFVDNLVKNPTDEMLKYATLDAETAVFQQDTSLGRIARRFQQEIPGGEIVVPFAKTPSAVAAQILNYSPVGVAKTIIQNIGKGRFDQRLFSQGLARGLTGTAVLAIGAELYKKGLISLSRPTSEKEQKLWELEGRQANSVKINGKWRQVQVLGPAGFLLVIGGHFQKSLEEKGSPTAAMVEAIAGTGKTLTDQTFLRGLDRLVNTIQDPKRNAVGYLNSTIASIIPTLVSDIARATDTKERRTKNALEELAARVPLLRKTLEPQVTVFGEEKPRQGSFLEVLADPTRPTTEIVDPAVWELRRLWNNGYYVSPTLLGDKNGYKILTPKQNTELWKTAGEIIRSKLNSLLKRDAYYQLDDEQKAKIINDIVDKAKIVARAEMVLKLTEGLEGQALIDELRKLKASGLMTKEVFNEFQKLR